MNNRIFFSKQVGIRPQHRHNITTGGKDVAWLNASRGRILGPNTSMEVTEGDSLTLSVFAKYEIKRKRGSRASLFPKGGPDQLISDLGTLSRSGAANPFTLFQIIDLIADDLQQKPVPEAYMGYALYDSDSSLYEKGKRLLSKKSENQHEELAEKVYVSRSGYAEVFLVNETNQDVFFDNFMVMSTPSIVVQETHYACPDEQSDIGNPWGLELTGLGFQAGGIKVNRYLYNGKELLDDLNLNLYDYGARYFDPVIGRWTSPDPMASEREWLSPYNYVQNNPMLLLDPDGMLDDYYYKNGELAFVLETDQEDRFYEMRENAENKSGYETVQIGNPEANPSALEYNNNTGYKYDKSDVKMRGTLLSLGSGNPITAELLRREERGNFQPITAQNYLRQVDERSARMMMFGETMFPAPGGNARLPSSRGFNYSRIYNHSQSRALQRGVSPSDIADARANPLRVSEVKYDSFGRPSQQYIGRNATVVVNPNTNKVITTWRTGSKTVGRLGNGN